MQWGSTTRALTNGFGAVFTDVDDATTSIEFFHAADQSLAKFFAPSVSGDEPLSFLGALFNEGSVVSRVRITSGKQVLAPGIISPDLVVMDDFIYGEPVPEPSTLLLRMLAMAAAIDVRARRSEGRKSNGADESG